MGLLDFIRKIEVKETKSKYENLPIIDVEADKRSKKGYVERKFVDMEKIYQECDNVFYGSNVPIVNQCKSAIKYIQTTVLQNKNGSKVRSVEEIIYYSIPDFLENNFFHLVDDLNKIIIQHGIPEQYTITLRNVKLTLPKDGCSKIPISYIQFDQEKNEFNFLFATEYRIPPISKKFEKYSSPVYDQEEIGCILYDKNGNMKKAHFYRNGFGKNKVKIRFKNYKTGFDLYNITHGNDVIYKR